MQEQQPADSELDGSSAPAQISPPWTQASASPEQGATEELLAATESSGQVRQVILQGAAVPECMMLKPGALCYL